MVIQENLRLLLINEDPFFKETEYQNPNGIRITIPARSVMFSDYNDDNGYPVYEFASLDYIRPVAKGDGIYDLVSTPLLDERYAAKREDTSDRQARVFHLVIKRRNSITGEMFPYAFSESSIREKLDSDRVSYQYGIATHKCDLYLEEDENEEIRTLTNRYRASGSTDEGGLDDYLRLHRKIFAGNQKPAHIHAVIRNESTDNRGNHNNMRLSALSKKLGIPKSCFQSKFDNSDRGGSDGFIDGIRYLTHETDKAIEDGKYQYPESIRTVNFDWKTEYEQSLESREKYGKHNMTPGKIMQYGVLYEGKTLRECEAEDPVLYMENLDRLKRLRLEYITRQAPPAHRINYYLYGKGGVGKDLMSRSLARALFPQYQSDDDIFFIVGGDKVPFDGYDGQPVLIWSDRRAGGLIKTLGGRENFFNVFETHPTKQRQNVKFGSVNLCNLVNIVNGQESYSAFLDGIAGEYKDRDGIQHDAEDKNQSYRRFPFIIPLHDEDFDLMINKGYMDDDMSLFQEYYQYMGIRGNMQQIAIRCGGENSLYKKTTAKVLKPVTDKHSEAIERHKQVSPSDEEIERWLEEKQYGKQIYTTGCDIIENDDWCHELYIQFCEDVATEVGRTMEEIISELDEDNFVKLCKGMTEEYEDDFDLS